MGWTDWIAPAAAWAGTVATGGAFAPEAIALTAGAAAKHAQSSAGDKALAAQTNAANQAIDTSARSTAQLNNLLNNTGQQYRDIFNYQTQQFSPYSSLGSGAAALLGAGTGIPVTMPQRVAITPSAGISLAPGQTAGVMNPPGLAKPNGTSVAPYGQGVTNPFPGSQGFSGIGQAQPFSGTGQTTGAGKVKMRYPQTGEIALVDPKDVQHYETLGASVVNS